MSSVTLIERMPNEAQLPMFMECPVEFLGSFRINQKWVWKEKFKKELSTCFSEFAINNWFEQLTQNCIDKDKLTRFLCYTKYDNRKLTYSTSKLAFQNIYLKVQQNPMIHSLIMKKLKNCKSLYFYKDKISFVIEVQSDQASPRQIDVKMQSIQNEHSNTDCANISIIGCRSQFEVEMSIENVNKFLFFIINNFENLNI